MIEYAIAAIVENPRAVPIPAELDSVITKATNLNQNFWFVIGYII